MVGWQENQGNSVIWDLGFGNLVEFCFRGARAYENKKNLQAIFPDCNTNPPSLPHPLPPTPKPFLLLFFFFIQNAYYLVSVLLCASVERFSVSRKCRIFWKKFHNFFIFLFSQVLSKSLRQTA